MPGYRPLTRAKTQGEIDVAARADLLGHEGRDDDAVALLLSLINEMEVTDEPLPNWPYGRLAFIYRRLGRNADEVDLLERYIALQPDEAQAVRFNARLSKARALLAKRSRSRIMPLRSDRASTIRCWASTVD